jgi:fermentation-respiration switch protein FrsA (DUF1100 family)
MTKMLLILTYAIGIYALLVLFLFFFQRSYLYFPSKEKIDVSYFIDSGLKEIELTTSDGLVLKSWFKKPRTQDGYTILIFHGNAGHVGHRVEKFKRFITAGYGFLFLEYRGYGGNPGKPTEKGLYYDALSALEFLSKQQISSDKTILYGESLGCGVAVKLSSEAAFAATVLEAPFTSIADVAQRHFWYLPAKWLVLDRYDILRIIGNTKSPLLVIHGEKDNIINISLGKKVFDAAPEPKEALFVPNAGHNNLFEFNVEEKLLIFLEKQKNY